jgi:hypothetical protein
MRKEGGLCWCQDSVNGWHEFSMNFIATDVTLND